MDHPIAQGGLKKVLGVWDLTSLGVAAIVGAGIFSTVGNAAFYGGPGVIFLFIFTAIACSFSALCYAEFASLLPGAGSAYSYAYTSFGELAAWVIGWDLLMEYAISNIAVAISWSEYFSALLAGYGIRIPAYLTMDPWSAYQAFQQVQRGEVQKSLLRGFQAWSTAPRIFGMPFVCNFPALFVTFLVTWVAYRGIREARLTSNLLVILKVAVILFVIGFGAFYVNPTHWVPFFPEGFSGVFRGTSAVFFAYIGFDAISTTAEECRNPQRDLPRGMMYSLLICTVLYALIALIITGMVHYRNLNVGDPLAYVFGAQGVNIPWVSRLVAMSAVVSLFTVLLVYQLGQPRIWMAMSRDGLLPKIFASIHPRFQTPGFSTILTGICVAVPSFFMNLTEVTDLTSIGTLFAFALVCVGSLRLGDQREKAKFKVPYINAKYIFPALFFFVLIQAFLHDSFSSESDGYVLRMFYALVMGILAWLSYRKNLSLIPVLGFASCTYLMTELGWVNWVRFGIWLLFGFGIYFLYGIRHSKLRERN
jgi:amino acid transporter